MVSDFPKFSCFRFEKSSSLCSQNTYDICVCGGSFSLSDDIGVKMIGLGENIWSFFGFNTSRGRKFTKLNVIESPKIANRYEKLF